MHWSRNCVVLLIFIVIFSIFVNNFANILNVDPNLAGKINSGPSGDLRLLKKQENVIINDSPEHLFWFLQITDIHISIFQDKKRIDDFEEFVGSTVDIVKPRIVLASGDLTDAKESNALGSRQYLEEWQIYGNILKRNNILNRSMWLDIRGNHDYFNVPNPEHPTNYFKEYSIQGGKFQNRRSYLHQIRFGGDKYSFIAVDSCPEPGLKRPFNFFGILNKEEMEHLIQLNDEARTKGGNYTIWFGHYPTSCILSYGLGNKGIRSIIGKNDESYAYLSGHLHTQGGLVPRMYTLQKDGFLELELGDWKDNRMFRIAAFDNGLFSFIDVRHNDWPVVLVTNPKRALFNLPNKEHINLQLNSKFIRMLIFSPSPVTFCKVRIDDEGDWSACTQHKNSKFFRAPWNPSQYKSGLHSLKVYVQTDDGKIKYLEHSFSLDGTSETFPLMARFILMIDGLAFIQAMFGLAIVLAVVPLCILRILHELVLAGRLKKPQLKSSRFCREIVRKFWILSATNRIFIPLVFYCIYMALGPWAFGEVIDGHWGVVFLWGVYVQGSFQPGTLTYMYGFFQLVFCQFPLTWIYASILEHNYRIAGSYVSNGTKMKKSFRDNLRKIKSHHIFYGIVIVMELLLAAVFWWSYGALAFVIGPIRTWSVIFHTVLFYLAIVLPEEKLKSSQFVWQN